MNQDLSITENDKGDWLVSVNGETVAITSTKEEGKAMMICVVKVMCAVNVLDPEIKDRFIQDLAYS